MTDTPDIVARLRERARAKRFVAVGTDHLLLEAADEIERLRRDDGGNLSFSPPSIDSGVLSG